MLDTVTLQTARAIAQAVNTYKGKNVDFESVCTHVRNITGVSREDVITTLNFIQELHGADVPIVRSTTTLDVDVSTPINLADEIRYNYAVGKALLKQIMEEDKTDKAEEIRKTLREISRFLEGMLKMQERVYNIQQLQKFQEAVLEVLGESPDRQRVVQLLLEADL